jgi:hypothetical protein
MSRFLCALAAFAVGVYAQLPNGEPAGAVPLVVGVNPSGPAGQSGATFSNAGESVALSTGLPAMCAPANSDVFFSFTPPNSALYQFATCAPPGFAAGDATDTLLQVLDAGGTLSLGCNDEACASLSSVAAALTAGVAVLVRVADWGSSVDTGAFYLTVAELPPPANDACAAPAPLTEGSAVAGTLVGAGPTVPNPAGCGSFSSSTPDAWYAWTASASGVARVVRSGPGANRLGVYVGACGGLTAVPFGCGATAQIVFEAVAGTTYLVRVGASSGAGAFSLLVEPPLTSTPSADDCANAAAVAPGTFAGTTVGATPSDPSPLCASFATAQPDVWFSFAPTTSCAVTLIRSAATAGATRLAVYAGADCSVLDGAGQPCTTATTASFDAIAGTTYRIRVGVAPAATGPFLIELQCVPFAANDGCTGATPLTLGANGPFSNAGTGVGLEPGFPATCAPGAARDLFFTFVPDFTGTATVTTCGGDALNAPGALADTALEVYDAWTCGVGASGAPLACNDDAGQNGACGPLGRESTVSFGAVAGATYLIRASAFGGATGTFSMNASLVSALAETIGVGCGAVAPATLLATAPPVFGAAGGVIVEAQPNGIGLLLASDPNDAGVYAPYGPCTVYLSQPGMRFVTPFETGVAGLWSVTTSYPPYDLALDGYRIDLQALVLGVAGAEFTNALRLTFGQ